MATPLTKTKTQWSRRLDARLVRQVQRRRCLWDPSHPHYKSAPRRHQAYAELSKKYGPQYSAEMVRDRWVSIRSTFAECFRKFEASRDSTDMLPEPSWYLWKACQFLMSVKDLDDTLAATHLLDSKVKMESNLDTDEDDSTMLHKSEEDDNRGRDRKVKTRDTKCSLDCNDIVQGLVSVFNEFQNGTLGQQNNEFDKVGRLVSKKLSQMNSYEAALTATKIMEILLLYDENNPDNPNNQLDIKYLGEES